MKKTGRFICAILCVVAFALCVVGCGSSGSSSSSNSGNKNGFVGSDGEYHPYVPEFGDDVNNWMAENW